MTFNSKPAPFSKTNLKRMDESDVDALEAETIRPHVVALLRANKLSSLADVEESILEFGLLYPEAIGTFVLVANDSAKRGEGGGLLAVQALREWAMLHRGDLMI